MRSPGGALGNHAGGQRVHHGDTHTVQTTGNGVAATAELTASVQHGHDNLNGGLVLGGVLIHGNTAAVILYANSTISLDGHVNFGGVAGERFVDRVIYNLVDQVVQTALSGRANVHAGRLRTASRPSSTVISDAPYSCCCSDAFCSDATRQNSLSR